jgi:hypothetical protein
MILCLQKKPEAPETARTAASRPKMQSETSVAPAAHRDARMPRRRKIIDPVRHRPSGAIAHRTGQPRVPPSDGIRNPSQRRCRKRTGTRGANALKSSPPGMTPSETERITGASLFRAGNPEATDKRSEPHAGPGGGRAAAADCSGESAAAEDPPEAAIEMADGPEEEAAGGCGTTGDRSRRKRPYRLVEVRTGQQTSKKSTPRNSSTGWRRKTSPSASSRRRVSPSSWPHGPKPAKPSSWPRGGRPRPVNRPRSPGISTPTP